MTNFPSQGHDLMIMDAKFMQTVLQVLLQVHYEYRIDKFCPKTIGLIGFRLTDEALRKMVNWE